MENKMKRKTKNASDNNTTIQIQKKGKVTYK